MMTPRFYNPYIISGAETEIIFLIFCNFYHKYSTALTGRLVIIFVVCVTGFIGGAEFDDI